MRSLLVAASAVIAGVLVGVPADACCPAPPPGARVQIADQDVIIVWDAATKTEHFIRRASFGTTATSFGFLVPTPSIPTLAAAQDWAFEQFAMETRPRFKSVDSYELGSLLFSTSRDGRPASGAATASSLSDVRVLARQRVAGYDAAILEADDPASLARWLTGNGFASPPELIDWVRPYIAQRWKITAFKLAAKDDGWVEDRGAASYAVRMSFVTEKPIFPFRTPSDQNASGPGTGLLRIYFLGTERVSGALGAQPWDAIVPHSAATDPGTAGDLLKSAGITRAVLAPAWLTELEDHAWPRAAADDLVFSRAADQSEVKRPPIIQKRPVTVPVELAIVPLIALFIWRSTRRYRA